MGCIFPCFSNEYTAYLLQETDQRQPRMRVPNCSYMLTFCTIHKALLKSPVNQNFAMVFKTNNAVASLGVMHQNSLLINVKLITKFILSRKYCPIKFLRPVGILEYFPQIWWLWSFSLLYILLKMHYNCFPNFGTFETWKLYCHREECQRCA